MGSRRLLYTAYSALLHDEQVYAVCRANTEMEYHLQINAKAENGQFACSRILGMTTVYTSFPGYDQRLTRFPTSLIYHPGGVPPCY